MLQRGAKWFSLSHQAVHRIGTVVTVPMAAYSLWSAVGGHLVERQPSRRAKVCFGLRIPLEPGDIIWSGTPEGVILGMPKEKQVWLKAGDEITSSIEKLGDLKFKLA